MKMVRWILLMVISIFFLTGCTKTESIEGRLTLNENDFLVDCSEQVKQNENDLSDVEYLCNIQISGETVFKDQDGETISVDEFSDGNLVSVVLSKPKVIGYSVRSRKVEAQEIILVEN